MEELDILESGLLQLHEIILIENEESSKLEVDLMARDIFCNLKVYDLLLRILLRLQEYCVTKHFTDYFSTQDLKKAHEETQPILFGSLFQILIAMTMNNTRMRVLLWKYKIDIIMPELGKDKGYGELQLISEILNDKALLSKAPDLDECLNQLKKRVSKDNICVILEIMSRVTIVTSNKFVISLVNEIINGSKDNEIHYKKLSAEEQHYFMLTYLNLIKENKVPMMMERLSQCYRIKSLYTKIKRMNKIHTDFFIDKFMDNERKFATLNLDSPSKQNEGGSESESGESSESDENSKSEDSSNSEDSSDSPRTIKSIDEYIIDIKFSNRNQYLAFFNVQYKTLFNFYFQIHFTKVIAKKALIENLNEFIETFLNNRVLQSKHFY